MKKMLIASLVLTVALVFACAPAPATLPPTQAPPAPPASTSETKVATKPEAGSPLTPTPKAKAPADTPYYQGKTIEFIVASAAGGGSDTFARILAGILPRFIPGNPRIIVRNIPGSMALLGNNTFYEKAKPDGLTLISSGGGPIGEQMRKKEGDSLVKYDLTKYKYIGNATRGESVIMVRKGLKARLTDPKAPPLVIGATEAGTTWNGPLLWGKEFLGWNLRWVVGFGGTGEVELAFQRGEIDVFGTSNSFIIRRLIQEGTGETITTTGKFKGDKFLRRDEFPDVPTFEEMLGAKKPAGIPWQAFLVWVGPSDLIDKWIATAPGTPDNIVAILIDAWSRASRDPEFDTVMKKMVSDPYAIGLGNDVEAIMKQVLATPPEAIDYGRELLKKFNLVK